ncbi:MAG TPA: hypothetical protein VGS97_28460 [Actinocrinis sp.]|nr:hypothetical protein [Actinocrinis sp.]HEV2348053.1 hypothetical protein [Actinocrinis sp.]
MNPTSHAAPDNPDRSDPARLVTVPGNAANVRDRRRGPGPTSQHP